MGNFEENWNLESCNYTKYSATKCLPRLRLPFGLEASTIYHGQEIGLLDDISCHLALIPSGYGLL